MFIFRLYQSKNVITIVFTQETRQRNVFLLSLSNFNTYFQILNFYLVVLLKFYLEFLVDFIFLGSQTKYTSYLYHLTHVWKLKNLQTNQPNHAFTLCVFDLVLYHIARIHVVNEFRQYNRTWELQTLQFHAYCFVPNKHKTGTILLQLILFRWETVKWNTLPIT